MFKYLAAIVLTMSVAVQALAQNAPPTRIRGTIVGLSGQVLTINTREGQKVEVTLPEAFPVATVKKIELSAVAAGSYIGTATRAGTGGTPQSIEVLVFPEAMRGASEGHFPWDLEQGSMMTNGTVSGVADAPAGRELTVTYKDSKITVHVPQNAPVVTLVPGDKTDVKPGAKVFTVATKNAEGHFTAARVTVGKDGVDPPM